MRPTCSRNMHIQYVHTFSYVRTAYVHYYVHVYVCMHSEAIVALTAQTTPSSGMVSASVTLLTPHTHTHTHTHTHPQLPPTNTTHPPMQYSMITHFHSPHITFSTTHTYMHATYSSPPHLILFCTPTYIRTSCMYTHRHTTYNCIYIHKDKINTRRHSSSTQPDVIQALFVDAVVGEVHVEVAEVP